MQTNHLQRKNPNMKRVIVARGGKRGKTAGRGGKGQSARAGNKRRPEWRDIIKKIPKLRGRGVNQNKPVTVGRTVINIDVIEAIFDTGTTITPALLVEKGIITTFSGRVPVIKILGDGEVTKKFNLSGLFVSAGAQVKIEKAGGTVTPVPSKDISKPAKEVTGPREGAVKKEEKEVAPHKEAKATKSASPKKETKKVEKKPAKK